jgi:hypothetical protein
MLWSKSETSITSSKPYNSFLSRQACPEQGGRGASKTKSEIRISKSETFDEFS